jgi:hypothetical protein
MWLTTIHGKPNLRLKLLEYTDHDKLCVFCKECKELGFVNNQSFEAMKVEKTVMPYGQYFIGLDDDKIFTASGVHKFPEINDNSWRCNFRGAQLPGYNTFSKNPFRSQIHFAYLMYYQIELIRSIYPDPEFYVTTNVSGGVDSHRMNDVFMPLVENMGIWELAYPHMEIYHTKQNVWRINVKEYLRQRAEYFTKYGIQDKLF